MKITFLGLWSLSGSTLCTKYQNQIHRPYQTISDHIRPHQGSITEWVYNVSALQICQWRQTHPVKSYVIFDKAGYYKNIFSGLFVGHWSKSASIICMILSACECCLFWGKYISSIWYLSPSQCDSTDYEQGWRHTFVCFAQFALEIQHLYMWLCFLVVVFVQAESNVGPVSPKH